MAHWGRACDDDPDEAANETGCSPTLRELGDFRIVRELGRGGMGTVFEAEQISMGRRVALKVLPFAALVHRTGLERFRNEVRAVAWLIDHTGALRRKFNGSPDSPEEERERTDAIEALVVEAEQAGPSPSDNPLECMAKC